MKNLQDILKISCEKYTIDDLANGWEFKSVLDHFCEVEAYFKDYVFSVPFTVDTIADYFIVVKICEWDFGTRVTPEYKQEYEQIKQFFAGIKSRYEIKRIFDFLKEFSFKIEDDNRFGLLFTIYDILPQYANSIQHEDIYVKAINEHPYLVLDRINQYKKALNSNTGLYNVLFSNENISKFLDYRFELFALEASNICKNAKVDDTLKQIIIDTFVNLANEIADNNDYKNALHNQIRYKTILNFFKNICFPRYAEYVEKQKKVDALSEEWLNNNGIQLPPFEFPLDEIKRQIDDPNIPWIIKYIQLTHMRNNDMWQHFSTEIIKKGKISLIDLVACANIDTNDHFGIMAQETIKLYHSLLGFALQVFVKTLDKWKRFAQYTYSIINSFFDIFSIPVDSILMEFTAWANNGADYFFNTDVDELKKKDLAYIFTDKTVKFTERILRTVYSEEMKRNQLFYDPNKSTLGIMLNYKDETNPLVKILSKEVMQYLSFCLITDTDNHGRSVGINLRNLLEHDKYDWTHFDNGNGILSLLVLLSVLNSFFIYYNANSD